MKSKNEEKKETFEFPRARKIEIDTSVSLLMTSNPPGNPGVPMGPPVKRERHVPFKHDGWESPFEV